MTRTLRLACSCLLILAAAALALWWFVSGEASVGDRHFWVVHAAAVLLAAAAWKLWPGGKSPDG